MVRSGKWTEAGLRLVPTLFSVLMNDLVNMLDGVGMDIDVGKQLINCLLFADDIALIAETEEELQRLLDVQKAPAFPLYPILPQQIKQTISPDSIKGLR
jgi:hypothetical protein